MSNVGKGKIYVFSAPKKVLHQGDVLRDVIFAYSHTIIGKAPINRNFTLPYAVVLSQECDLTQHYDCVKKIEVAKVANSEANPSQDKILDSVLICPAYPMEQFVLGKHIDSKTMFDFMSSGFKKIATDLSRNDKWNRFHYLPALVDNNESTLFAELIIDFKNFHTIPIDIAQQIHGETYLASLGELFRERLSQRFSNYLSRIGLPDDMVEAAPQ